MIENIDTMIVLIENHTEAGEKNKALLKTHVETLKILREKLIKNNI